MSISIKYHVETISQNRTMIYNFKQKSWQLKYDVIPETCMTHNYNRALYVYNMRLILSNDVTIRGVAYSAE